MVAGTTAARQPRAAASAGATPSAATAEEAVVEPRENIKNGVGIAIRGNMNG